MRYSDRACPVLNQLGRRASIILDEPASTPLVSVQIPAHNAERYLEECLTSLVSQTYENFELLVGDDRSSDRTAAIVEAYGKRDARVRLCLHQGPPGAASCRNSLIQAMNRDAEFIAIMDADDVCHPRRLELQVAALQSQPEWALVGTAIELMDERSQPIAHRAYPSTPKEVQRAKLLFNPFAAPSVMVRTAVIRAVGGYDEARKRLDDYELWLRILSNYDGANLPESLLRYRLLFSEKSAKSQAILRAGIALKLKHASGSDWARPVFWGYLLAEALLSQMPGAMVTRLFLLFRKVSRP